jgi:hypothetical protein
LYVESGQIINLWRSLSLLVTHVTFVLHLFFMAGRNANAHTIFFDGIMIVILASELQDMSMQNLQMQIADPAHIQVLM